MDNSIKPIERLLLAHRVADRKNNYLSWQFMYGRTVMSNIKTVHEGVTSNHYLTLTPDHLKEILGFLRQCAQAQEQCVHQVVVVESAHASSPGTHTLVVCRNPAGEIWIIINHAGRGHAGVRVVDASAYADLFEEVFTEIGWIEHEEQSKEPAP